MRIIKQSLSALVLLGFALSPLATQAAVNTTRPADNASNFCTRLAIAKSVVNGLVTKAEATRGTVRTDILNKLKDRKTQRATQIQKNRDNAKAAFEAAVVKIEAKATTDAQIAAVATFKTTVETAISTRQAAVDAAVAAYQASLTQLVGAREDVIKNAAATMKSSVAAATATAQASCTAGDDPVTIRTTLITSIKTASETFRGSVSVKVNGSMAQQLKDIAQTRDAAIKAANEAFRTTIQKAKADLKSVMASA
jgi:hypothetical protein